MPRSSKYRVPHIEDVQAHIIVPERASRKLWLEGRRAGIGGSEIGALIGASEYMTPFDVFRNKVQAVQELSGIPAIEWGHRLEDAVAKKAADDLGLASRAGGGLWQSDHHDWALVTPDRLATKRLKWDAVGLIECKTAGDDEYWADGSSPLAYQAQVQWQLGILGLKVGWLACLVLGHSRDFYIHEIKFDQEWFDEMLDVAHTFWVKNVMAWEPPMHDLSHPRTTELAKELYPKVIQPSVELDEDAVEWVKEFVEAKALAKKATERVERAQNGLRLYLADAGAGYWGDQKLVSYPEVSSTRIDVEALREKYPDIADEVTVRSKHRRMVVKPPELEEGSE